MVNVKRGHKLCQDCEKRLFKKNAILQNVKYTIKNYKNATKYMKLKNYKIFKRK